MRITWSGEVLVTGAELLVDVEAVDVGLSMVGESMAITVSWVRFPSSGSWSRVLLSIHTARPVVLPSVTERQSVDAGPLSPLSIRQQSCR